MRRSFIPEYTIPEGLDFEVDEEFTPYLDGQPRLRWDTNGFGNPTPGFWRKGNGDEVWIPKMDTSHIRNAITHMRSQFGVGILTWPITIELMEELYKRSINEWDS